MKEKTIRNCKTNITFVCLTRKGKQQQEQMVLSFSRHYWNGMCFIEDFIKLKKQNLTHFLIKCCRVEKLRDFSKDSHIYRFQCDETYLVSCSFLFKFLMKILKKKLLINFRYVNIISLLVFNFPKSIFHFPVIG